MTSYDRFRNRNQKRIEAQAQLNSHFLIKGYPSIKITGDADGAGQIQAVVVNQQEKDQAYIYTQLDQPLAVGSTWGAKGLHWLISEEIVVIKDVNWHKYLAYLCNINIDNIWGYFKGPEKNYVNIKNEYGASLESLQKPVLVLPENVLGFSDKIVIKKRPWLVQEWDAISSPGLVYYSLRATTVSKEIEAQHEGEDVYIEHVENNVTPIDIRPVEESTSKYIIGHNIDLTVTTEQGYFVSSVKEIKVKKHNATEVIFSIPFGIDTVEIQTKKGGEVVTETYVTK